MQAGRFYAHCMAFTSSKDAFDGDTLLPVTTFYYLQKWLFYTGGIVLQAPLPLAFLFLSTQGII